MAEPILRVAAKAVIVTEEGKVLILREAATNPDGANPGKYHLPGGRLEAGEAFKEALRREILEETGIVDLEILYPVHVDEWRPVIRGQETQIVGVFVLCKAKATNVKLSGEHDESIWINPADYGDYDLLEAESAALQAFLYRPASPES